MGSGVTLWNVTQQQPYETVANFGDIEIRRYPRHTVAEVLVPGDFDEAGNRGFRPLFGYIKGRIAMTAPVVVTPGDEGNAVAFVMPADREVDTLPEPGDSRVHLREVPEEMAAVLRFSGWGDAADLQRQGGRLLDALASTGWRPIGPVRMARFNAPYVPPFLRHNEVAVAVRKDVP